MAFRGSCSSAMRSRMGQAGRHSWPYLVSPSHAAVDYSDMATLTRRRLLAMLGAGGGLLGLGYVLRSIVVDARLKPANAGPGFGGATGMDMSMYMEMFSRHNEIRRTVEEIPGDVRTTTESDSPDLAALLLCCTNMCRARIPISTRVAKSCA
jgi:hypothetical protein